MTRVSLKLIVVGFTSTSVFMQIFVSEVDVVGFTCILKKYIKSSTSVVYDLVFVTLDIDRYYQSSWTNQNLTVLLIQENWS